VAAESKEKQEGSQYPEDDSQPPKRCFDVGGTNHRISLPEFKNKNGPAKVNSRHWGGFLWCASKILNLLSFLFPRKEFFQPNFYIDVCSPNS
jgi:hypothetical protein